MTSDKPMTDLKPTQEQQYAANNFINGNIYTKMAGFSKLGNEPYANLAKLLAQREAAARQQGIEEAAKLFGDKKDRLLGKIERMKAEKPFPPPERVLKSVEQMAHTAGQIEKEIRALTQEEE